MADLKYLKGNMAAKVLEAEPGIFYECSHIRSEVEVDISNQPEEAHDLNSAMLSFSI